jgi:hypothetical protein
VDLSGRVSAERGSQVSKTNCVEVEFDERCYEDLVGEAERLGVAVERVIERATAAWLTEVLDERPPMNGRRHD